MKKHIIQFFNFLEDKEGKPVPLRLKLLDPQTFGKPTKDQLVFKGHLDLRGTNIKELPKGLQVGWTLNLERCYSLKELPQGLQVGKHLNLTDCTSLEKLPQGLKVGWSLSLYGCTSFKELPQDLQVGWDLFLENTPIAKKYSEDDIRKIIEDGGGFVNGKIIM